MQESYQCFFFIADWHALTTHPDGKYLKDSVKKILAEYLACGINPDKASIYLQSDVPQIAELYLLLNMHAYLGELERTTSFKEKARKQPQNVNAGLLTYPVLMAADIIIHKALKVPVGKDQEQNLEMTRKFVRRFNKQYNCNLLPVPEPFSYYKEMIKVPGLDGSGKMGKSKNNGIYLYETPEDIRKKIMRAVTDSGPIVKNQPKTEPVQNLFLLMDIVSTKKVYTHFEKQYNDCTIKYGDFKKQLAEDIISFTTPFRERITAFLKDETYLENVLKKGAEQAKESAQRTLNEIRTTIGFRIKKL